MDRKSKMVEGKVLFLAQSFVRFKDDISSHYLFSLAKHISESGFQVKVVAPHQSGLKKAEVIDGLPIFRFRYMVGHFERLAYTGNMYKMVKENLINKFIFVFFLFFFFLKAYRISKSYDIPIVHAHWWVPSGLVGCLVSILLKRQLLVTTHGTDLRILDDSKIFSLLARFVFRRAQYVTVVSSFLKTRLVSRLNLPEKKILVIPMPVNTQKIKFSPGRKENSENVILCVARYTKQKKLDVLIGSLSLLKEWEIDFKAIFIGEGPEKENLKEKINDLSLMDRIKLLDLIPQKDLNHYYNLSRAVVLPSVNEGFGLVLVEAGLCKKTVIGACSGGIPDIIEDGVTGLLVPPDDYRALAHAMRKILSDEGLAKRLGENAYQQVWKRFSPEAITRRFLFTYRKLICN